MDNGINLLIEALVEITNTTSNGNKGEDFESQISQILSKVGFTKCSLEFKSPISISKSLPNLSKNEYNELTKIIKDSIIEKNNIQVVKNPFSNYFNSNIYIYISTVWFATISRFFNINKKLCYTTRN